MYTGAPSDSANVPPCSSVSAGDPDGRHALDVITVDETQTGIGRHDDPVEQVLCRISRTCSTTLSSRPDAETTGVPSGSRCTQWECRHRAPRSYSCQEWSALTSVLRAPALARAAAPTPRASAVRECRHRRVLRVVLPDRRSWRSIFPRAQRVVDPTSWSTGFVAVRPARTSLRVQHHRTARRRGPLRRAPERARRPRGASRSCRCCGQWHGPALFDDQHEACARRRNRFRRQFDVPPVRSSPASMHVSAPLQSLRHPPFPQRSLRRYDPDDDRVEGCASYQRRPGGQAGLCCQ